MSDNIWRPRAVWLLQLLWVAFPFTKMLSTVKLPLTLVTTLETSVPFFGSHRTIIELQLSETFLLISPLTTHY